MSEETVTYEVEGNVATVPGFVAIPTRIAELSAQLAASRPDLSVDALKQRLHKLLGLPAELPHELLPAGPLISKRCDSRRRGIILQPVYLPAFFIKFSSVL